MINLPNILSWVRVFISPVFLILFLIPEKVTISIAVFLYIVGVITDYFDGYLARKMNLVSKFGKFFDPLADKVLTAAAYIAFIYLEVLPIWMVIIVLIRDFGTTFLRVYYDNNNIDFQTSYFAKLKTFIQMTFIAYLLFLFLIKYFSNEQVAKFCNELIYSNSTKYIMFGITIITVITLLDYLWSPLKKKYTK